MDLLVDIGNTSIKWATWDGARLGIMGSARHHGALPIDVLAAWDGLTEIDRIVVGRVGPAKVLEAVEQVGRSCWDCRPQLIETAVQAHGVRIAYAEPARLGVDRFLALIGARALQGDRPTLIIDAGTAITYDLLDAAGTHLGGLILPGIGIMRDSLLVGTQIPRYEPLEADTAWAADTAEAIAAASIQAPAALAERLHHRLGIQTGSDPAAILTGGDAERLQPAIVLDIQYQPDLVLHGLSRFA
jgi:type III pantothenate kinase